MASRIAWTLRFAAVSGALVVAIPNKAFAQEASAPSRVREWTRSAFLSPDPFVAGAVGAAIDHLGDDPAAWGQGGSGFGRRFLSSLGVMQAQIGIEHGVAAIARHPVGYRACRCAGVWRRVGYALSRTIVTRTDSGRPAPNVAVLSSRYGSAMLETLWRPEDGQHPLGRGFAVGHAQLGGEAALNVVREFAHELKRLLPGR